MSMTTIQSLREFELCERWENICSQFNLWRASSKENTYCVLIVLDIVTDMELYIYSISWSDNSTNPETYPMNGGIIIKTVLKCAKKK